MRIALFCNGIQVTPWQEFTVGCRIDIPETLTFTEARVINGNGDLIKWASTYPFANRTVKAGDWVKAEFYD